VAPSLQLKRNLECIRKDHREDLMYTLSIMFGSNMFCPRLEALKKLRGTKVQTRMMYEYDTSSVQVYIADSGMIWSGPSRIPYLM
jgi:hypothetical protein